MAAKTHPGITTRHRKPCRSREGGRCNCRPSYEAWVFSKRDGRKIRRTFSDLAEAKSWRSDAQGAVRKRTMRAPSKTTLEEAGKVWLAGAAARYGIGPATATSPQRSAGTSRGSV